MAFQDVTGFYENVHPTSGNFFYFKFFRTITYIYSIIVLGTPFKKALDDIFHASISPEKENLAPDLPMELLNDDLAIDEHLPSYEDIEMNPSDFLCSPEKTGMILFAAISRNSRIPQTIALTKTGKILFLRTMA